MYEFADTGATYSQGKSIASLDGNARSSGRALVTALSSVNPGFDHGAPGLEGAIEKFETDTSQDSHSTANAVANLGENTAKGSVEVQNTQNEGTHVANTTTSLARTLNQQTSVLPTAG